MLSVAFVGVTIHPKTKGYPEFAGKALPPAWRIRLGEIRHGKHQCHPMAFARPRDAEAAIEALMKAGLDSTEKMMKAGRKRTEQVMLEAMQW